MHSGVHDFVLSIRLPNHPVTSLKLSAFQFLKIAMHTDKCGFHAVECVDPVPTKFICEYDFITYQIDAASSYGGYGPTVRL